MPYAAELNLRRLLADCTASVRGSFSDHVPLYLCTLSFGFVTAVLVTVYRLPLPFASPIFFLATTGKLILLTGAVVGLKHLWRLSREGQTDRPLQRMLQGLLQSALVHERFGNVVHGLINFAPLMVMFAAVKPDIVRIRPFGWDQAFMKFDLATGFGRPAWQLLQPLLGHPPITAFLSMAYWLWFPVMFGCFFWQLTRPKNDLTRSQFLLSYGSAWFLAGFVLATIFSSAGPCYYGHVAAGPNPYAQLMQYLHETAKNWPVWTVDTQDALWQSYLTGTGDIEGVSAMPSMHLVVATLMTLLAWRTNRALGIAFAVFTFVILISTIMVGWHYPIDGLAGIAIGYVLWILAGQISRRWARDGKQLLAKPALLAPIASSPDPA